MSTIVNSDTGEVSISDTCQVDSPLELEVIFFVLLFFSFLKKRSAESNYEYLTYPGT